MFCIAKPIMCPLIKMKLNSMTKSRIKGEECDEHDLWKNSKKIYMSKKKTDHEIEVYFEKDQYEL